VDPSRDVVFIFDALPRGSLEARFKMPWSSLGFLMPCLGLALAFFQMLCLADALNV